MATRPTAMKEAFQMAMADIVNLAMSQIAIDHVSAKEKIYANTPLYANLISDEIFEKSHLEQRLVKILGNTWIDLAVVAARIGLGHGNQKYRIHGMVKLGRLIRIQHVLNALDFPLAKGKGRTKPDWDSELAYVLEGGGEDIPVQIVCDVYAEDATNNKRYAFELKAPLPNSDQTKVSKEKMLKLYSMEPLQIDGAYYALPYNPYGKRENYNWSFSSRWFNMREDKVVLIGDEFWEKIGGLGTYQAFISAVNEIGKEYKERIYREFLGIEPPESFQDNVLQ
jgi:hypothetical protein